MDRTDFIQEMEIFSLKLKQRTIFFDKLYDLLGSGADDAFSEVDFLSDYLTLLRNAINDKYEYLNHLIFECEGSFEKFNNTIFLEDNESVNVKDYGELYDFIRRMSDE